MPSLFPERVPGTSDYPSGPMFQEKSGDLSSWPQCIPTTVKTMEPGTG